MSSRRRGRTLAVSAAAIAAVTCLSLAGWFLTRRSSDAESLELLTTAVWKGPYDFAVIEQGTVESSSNTEIRSYVHSRSGSTTILDVVPEGTFVNEGDVLVELDSSNLRLEENAQQILVSTRESLLSEAENTLKAAQIAKTEYLDGLYVSEEKQILSELYLADRAEAIARSGLESAKSLHAKGIVTALQVEAAQSSLQDASNQVDATRTRLKTLRDLTKQKEATLLEAAIASAEANVKAQQKSLQLEQDRLKEIQDQIAKCTIKATAPGHVVYANESTSYGSSQFLVAPGATVRERQVIIWLPNANDMQVKATVNEARVTQIKVGLPVSIRVDAFRDEVVEGVVTKVSEYAEPTSFWSGSIKKYATLIKIKNPPRELRVGMNTEVRIHVKQMPEALQLPVQALAESKGHFFSLVKTDDGYETREITIGSTNDKVATIEAGLAEGDEVVMNPRSAGGLLQFPNLPERATVVRSAPQQADVAEADVVARLLENDANKDDKLSKEEMSKLELHWKQRLIRADANGDGFLERDELRKVSSNVAPPIREKSAGNHDASPVEPIRPPRREPSSSVSGGPAGA